MLKGAAKHINAITPPLNRKTWNRIQRGRPTRFTGREVEACVMPGATDRVAFDDSVGKRCAVMGARGADSKERLPTANDQDRFPIRLSGNRLAFFQRRAGDPILQEVWTT
jgi:hypothetical protein